jgi:ATP-dependent RNA helicase DDX3X
MAQVRLILPDQHGNFLRGLIGHSFVFCISLIPTLQFSLDLPLINLADTNSDADHTYLMFSATFPKEARRLARDYMDEDFVRIKVGRVGSTHQNIQQDIVYVEEPAKNQALFDLIMAGEAQRTLIFVNTKVKCDQVDDFLYNKALPVTSLHSDRTQREREDAL